MTIQPLLDLVDSFDGAETLAPGADSGAPPIAWGDFTFDDASDGQFLGFAELVEAHQS